MTSNEANDNAEKLTAIIVDDEELARKGLAMRLEKHTDVEVVQECATAGQALDAIGEHEPDLLFLDIQMPGMTGLEMVQEIQTDILPQIIFITAYDEYAVDAFKLHAADYLLKPVEDDRLADAIARAKLDLSQERAAKDKEKLLNLVINLTGKSASAIAEILENSEHGIEYPDRLAIKDGSSITFVPIENIDWIDAAGDYMCVHAGGETHIMRTTMKELESRLNPSIFQRVHRSTIVNLKRVEKVSSHINGEFHLTLSCGSSLKMSRSYKDKVKHFF